MTEAVKAYRHVATSEEFKQLQRSLSKAGHDEAQALFDSKQEGIEQGIKQGAKLEREKWESLVAEKDTTLEYQAKAIAEKDEIIEKLMSQLESKK